MKNAMLAIIKKDFRGVTSNKNQFSAMLIVPLVLTILLPSVFVFLIHFVPEDPDIQTLVELLPPSAREGNLELTVVGLILNFILPAFFLMIPIMTASIMAASSFVGEKERHTLETLLYCPLSVKQIFRAKVEMCVRLSLLVTGISLALFAVTIVVGNFLLDMPFWFDWAWVVLIVLLAPALTVFGVVFMVLVSGRSKSYMPVMWCCR